MCARPGQSPPRSKPEICSSPLTVASIKLLDFFFGLAKRTNDAVEAGPTVAGIAQVGTAVGTVAYMSPEQARGSTLDGRSDLFSLGAVLTKSGDRQPAFAGPTSAVIFEAISSRHISRRSIAAPIPAGFAAIVERLLAKTPENRFPDARAGGDALREITGRRDSEVERAASAPTRIPSIAVLPFADMSAQKDQDYFCEGMAEELITRSHYCLVYTSPREPRRFALKVPPTSRTSERNSAWIRCSRAAAHRRFAPTRPRRNW